jgi:hypothetical protein
MNRLSAAGLAGLAGVTEAEVQRLVELGILGCRRPMSGWPGPVVIQGGDYFGRTVNLAARIAARAGPGRVLVSQHVAESAPPGRCGLHGRRRGRAQGVRLSSAAAGGAPGVNT